MHTPQSLPPAGRRSAVIDLAKGVAITLVVIAHYNPGDLPRWWTSLNDIISRPDVRIFFVLAGYTWHLRPGERYWDYLGRKARRLLVPYFAVAALFLSIKLVPSLLIDLRCPVSRASVVNVLVDPLHSYMPLLWFLYSLFCIQAVFPILRRLGPRTFPVLIAITALWGVPTSLFCLGPTLGSLPYFLMGVYLAEVLHLDLDRHIPRQALLAILGVALFLGIWTVWTPETTIGWRAEDTLLGMIGIAAIIMLCQSVAARKSCSLALLASIGTSSLAIYLFHTLFESSVRIALYGLPVLRDLPFLVKAIPSIVAGICLPLIAQRLVLRMTASWPWGKTGTVVSRSS